MPIKKSENLTVKPDHVQAEECVCFLTGET